MNYSHDYAHCIGSEVYKNHDGSMRTEQCARCESCRRYKLHQDLQQRNLPGGFCYLMHTEPIENGCSEYWND